MQKEGETMQYKNLNSLKSLMQKEIDGGYINGSAIRIIQNGEIIYQDELGYADKENEIPVKRDTIYRMYSMSKPVTAVAAMILYERGLLDLFAPVSDFLEGFKNQKVWIKDGLVEVEREVTVQDLLNMTSGVVYPDTSFEAGRLMQNLYDEIDKECREGQPVSTMNFCNRIGRQPLEFQPGKRWRYGASADVLGAVMEVVSGKKLSCFLQDEIFTPLGMEDTGFFVPEDKWHRFARIYEYIPEHKQLEPCTWSHLGIGDLKTSPAFESGGAGLVSTMEDYSRFAIMLENGGTYRSERILGVKTVNYISQPQINDKQ
jgi:CubicO group peptidase (beta-lactamase class C family)